MKNNFFPRVFCGLFHAKNPHKSLKHNKMQHVCLCIACALLVHCLCIACAVHKHNVADMEIKERGIAESDTSRVEIINTTNDSTHYFHTETEKVRIVERFDPQTGILTERLTDSERQTELLQDVIKTQDQRIEVLEGIIRQMQQRESETYTESERESAPPWHIWLCVGLLAFVVGFVCKRVIFR